MKLKKYHCIIGIIRRKTLKHKRSNSKAIIIDIAGLLKNDNIIRQELMGGVD